MTFKLQSNLDYPNWLGPGKMFGESRVQINEVMILMTDCITPRSAALANTRTLLSAPASVSFRDRSGRSAVAGGVVARRLDHSQLVPTATIHRLTSTHTPRCGTKWHARLQSVRRLPRPVCSQLVRSLPPSVQCSVAYCCRRPAIPGRLLLRLKRSQHV